MGLSLLSKVLANAKKADIQDGITDNCVILEVSNDKRKNKNGESDKRNTHIKFGKLDDKGVVVAEKEISYFNIQHDSDWAYDNIFEQLFQMTKIAEVIVDPEDVDDAFNEVFEEEEIENVADLQDTAKSKNGVKSLMDGLSNAFVKLLKKKIGVESQTMRLKLTYDTKGRYIQQPKYGSFVESTKVDLKDSMLKLSNKELEYKAKADQPAAPASTASPSL